MFSIWVTVAITWLRKAMSEISLSFFAIRRKRRLGPKPNPASSGCANLKLRLRVQCRRETGEDAVDGLPIVEELGGDNGAGRKRLLIAKIDGAGVLLERGHAVQLQVGLRQREVLDSTAAGDQRIEAGNVGTDAQRRLHQSGRACARTACATSRAARARSGSSCAKAADAAARRVLHDTGIDAAEGAACLRAQDVSVGDGQVVARDHQVEIVFQCQIDRVPQRDVELAVANQTIAAATSCPCSAAAPSAGVYGASGP